jgi:hypothetical protein
MKPSRFTLILAVLVTALFAGGTAWAATNWYVDPAGNDANTCLAPAATACLTINGAIGKASAGDTINVAVGTYNEQVNINKDNLKVLGAQNGVDARTRSGAESIIDNACGPVQIRADNVTLDGFTVQGSTSTDLSCFFAGIWTSNGNSGHQLLNNIVQNNIIGIYLNSNGANASKAQFNLIRNNNNPGSSTGSGIYSDSGLSNALIDSNNFVGQTSASVNLISTTSLVTVSGNVLDVGIGLFASSGVSISGNASVGNTTSGTIYIGGGDSAVTITGNALLNGVEAIVVEDASGVGPSTGVTANGNCISGNSTNGLRVESAAYTPGTLDATGNWWGAASGPKYNGGGPGTGDNIADTGGKVVFSPFQTVATPACNLLATSLADFRDVRRPADINVGPDVCGTGNSAINLTGSTGSAGDTWITVYDTTPADDTVQNTFGNVSLSADVIIRPFNNRKGAGLLALFNEGTAKKGLALLIYDAGNTDTLVLGTVSKANGTFTVLTKVALANRIQECAWYRLTMDVAVDGGVTVTGNVFKHVTPTSPNSAVDGLVGTLTFTGTLPTGVDTTGEVGIVGSAFSAVLDSSVTNFTINP